MISKKTSFLFFLLSLFSFKGISQCNDWDRLLAIPYLYTNDATRDAFGNLYVVGSIGRAVQVGSVSLPYDHDFNGFIIKFDKDNKAVWGKSVSNGDNRMQKVAIDRFGNLIVSGIFYSSFINWDCIRLTNTSNRSDAYVAKLTPAGTTIWAKNFAGGNDESVSSLKIAPNNDIVLAGPYVSSSLNVGGVTIINKGGYDSFVVRLNDQGNTVWAKDIGGVGSAPDYVWEVAVDSKGNVAIGGWYESPVLQIDNFFLNATAISKNYFLAKIDPTGKTLWAKGPQVVLNYGIEGLAVDSNDNIYGTGSYVNGAVSFDGIALTNSGDADIFLVKYNTDGIVQWAKGIGGARYETGYKIAIDQLNNIYLAGYFYSYTIDIGTDHFTKTEFTADLFLSKIDVNGNILCSKRTHGIGDDLPLSLFTDSNNNVFVYSFKLLLGEVYFDNVFASTDPAVSGVEVQLGNNNSFPTDPNGSPPIYKINLGRDTTLCLGTKITLNAGNFCNAIYRWSTNNTSSSIQVSTAGLYWVEVTFAGTLLRDTIKIDYYPPLIFNLGNDTEKCYYNSISLSIPTIPGTAQWNDGTIGFQKLVKDPGLYWITVKNKCEQKTDSIKITNLPRIKFDLGKDRRLCDSINTILKVNVKDATYTWNDGDHEPIKEISESGKYWVTVANLCEAVTDSVKVDFVNPSKLFFPNVITPNGDTKNEFYEIDKIILGSEFEVFNRWGQSVFYAKQYQNNWNGENLTTGHYFYVLKENCKNTVLRGSVSVLR